MRFERFLIRLQWLNSIRLATKGVVQLLTTLFVVSLCLFPALTAAASPHVYDAPQIGPPTSATMLVGNGFDPNATLDFYFDSTNVGFIVTDSHGSFGLALAAPTIRQGGATIHVPKDAVPGAHTITAVERITQLQAQVAFTVRTDWAQYQFDAQRTGFNPYENVLSPETVGSLAVNWQVGKWTSQSSPVVANGVVYIGGSINGVNSLYALNATTGAVLWTYSGDIFGFSAPAVANGLVYIESEDDSLFAVNANTGALVWKDTDAGGASSPAVVNGVVYASGLRNVVTALNATTGVVLWKTKIGGPSYSSPSVANGMVYVGSIDTNLYALNASTGAIVWKYRLGAEINSSPVVINGVLYFTPGLSALDASTGALLWQAADCECVDTPAVANGVVYAGSVQEWFGVAAYNANTGAMLWRYNTDGGVLSSPVAANGVVYAADESGNLYALNPDTGALLWKYRAGSTYSSPTVVNGMLYISSDDMNFYAFGLPSQQMSEKFSPPERPNPVRLTPNWDPNTAATPSKK